MITSEQVTPTSSPFEFVTEASTIGIPAGTMPPPTLTTNMGNQCPLLRLCIEDDGTVRYIQLWGCVALVVLND